MPRSSASPNTKKLVLCQALSLSLIHTNRATHTRTSPGLLRSELWFMFVQLDHSFPCPSLPLSLPTNMFVFFQKKLIFNTKCYLRAWTETLFIYRQYWLKNSISDWVVRICAKMFSFRLLLDNNEQNFQKIFIEQPIYYIILNSVMHSILKLPWKFVFFLWSNRNICRSLV